MVLCLLPKLGVDDNKLLIPTVLQSAHQTIGMAMPCDAVDWFTHRPSEMRTLFNDQSDVMVCSVNQWNTNRKKVTNFLQSQ